MSVRQILSPNLYNLFFKSLTIHGTTPSTSTSTGAFVISGGIGIGETVNTDKMNIWSTIASTSTSTGAMTVVGGVGVGGRINIGSSINATSDAGALMITSGGISAENGYYTDYLRVAGQTNILNTTNTASTSTGALVVSGGIGVAYGVEIGGNLGVGMNTILRSCQITNTTVATSTSSGSLVVVGGMGIGEKLYVGSGVYLPTSGGTASSLNYYEEFSEQYAVSGCFVQDLALTVKYVRIGKCVSLSWNAYSEAAAANQPIFTGAFVPTRFSPVADIRGFCGVKDNSVDVSGTVEITTGGVITFRVGYNTFFQNSGNAGWGVGSITYNVA